VTEGAHQIQAILHSTKPYYFTTPEQIDINAESEAHFGVAYSQSSLVGEVMNDMNRPVAGIIVNVAGENHRFTATTGADGKLLMPRLPEGSYEASIDGEALPPVTRSKCRRRHTSICVPVLLRK